MIAEVAIATFVLAAVCGGVRLVVGPTIADRVIALDVILLALMAGLVVAAIETGVTIYLVVVVVIAIIGFTATVAASRFIEQEADQR